MDDRHWTPQYMKLLAGMRALALRRLGGTDAHIRLEYYDEIKVTLAAQGLS
jgi:hypothetical protein